MNLDYVLAKKELLPNRMAGRRWPMPFTWKRARIDFYRRMSQGCSGAPMAPVFDRF